MDTLFLPPNKKQKTAMKVVGIAIAVSVLVSQNWTILAKDLGIHTGISPTITYIKEEQLKKEYNYNNKIFNKYSNYEIKKWSS